jgi:hypothetical protein
MMKKNKLIHVFVILLFGLGCQNEPYEGDFPTENNTCLSTMQATANAAQNFLTSTDDDYSLFCQIYRDALEDEIEICGDEDGSLQLLLETLGSCEVINLCEEAIAASETARIIYESAADQTIEDLCNAYKNALDFQIEVCGDDGTLQSIIEGLGDCLPEVVEIPGTWKLVSWNTDELRDLDNDGVVTNNYLDDINCYDNETILFNTDGTGTMFLRSLAEFTYAPNNSSDDGVDFFVVCNDISIDKPFTWTETINSVSLLFTDGTSMNLFKNGGLYIAIDDAFYAESTIDNSIITERITFVYNKL